MNDLSSPANLSQYSRTLYKPRRVLVVGGSVWARYRAREAKNRVWEGGSWTEVQGEKEEEGKIRREAHLFA